MEEMIVPFLVIGGIVVLIGGGIWYAHWYEKKRRENLLAVAEEMGLVYLPDGDPGLFNQLSGSKLFSSGRAKKLRNLIQGDTDEVKIAIFDYQYTTGSGKHQHTHHQSVACLQSPKLSMPDFSMRPEGMFDKIGGMMGFQDIDFDSHPDFSRMFVLKSSNEGGIRQFFTPPVLEFFEKHKGISVEGDNGTMFFYRSGRRVKPDQIRELLEQAYEVYGIMVEASSQSMA